MLDEFPCLEMYAKWTSRCVCVMYVKLNIGKHLTVHCTMKCKILCCAWCFLRWWDYVRNTNCTKSWASAECAPLLLLQNWDGEIRRRPITRLNPPQRFVHSSCSLTMLMRMCTQCITPKPTNTEREIVVLPNCWWGGYPISWTILGCLAYQEDVLGKRRKRLWRRSNKDECHLDFLPIWAWLALPVTAHAPYHPRHHSAEPL